MRKSELFGNYVPETVADTLKSNTFSNVQKFSDDIVLPKTTNKGIKVDIDSPSFGWRDIIGTPAIRTAGSNNPTVALYASSGIRGYKFDGTATMNEIFIDYHIPHDYVPGTAIHFHVHWSDDQNTPPAGNVVWNIEYIYARGGLANGTANGAFPATGTTVSITQTASTTARTHMIAETTAITITGLEVDGIIQARIYRDPNNAADTYSAGVFVHSVDIHYQSTNMATKSKTAGAFYS